MSKYQTAVRLYGAEVLRKQALINLNVKAGSGTFLEILEATLNAMDTVQDGLEEEPAPEPLHEVLKPGWDA